MIDIAGGCHCGAVRFEARVGSSPQLLDCNCSICSMTGYLHLTVPHENFTLKSGNDALVSYRFGTRSAKHLFCKHCGIKSFYQPRSHPDSWSIHYHCIDDNTLMTPEIIALDGQNWEDAVAKLRNQSED